MFYKKNKAEDVLELFKYRIKTKIIRDKEAYLLHNCLKMLNIWVTNMTLKLQLLNTKKFIKTIFSAGIL